MLKNQRYLDEQEYKKNSLIEQEYRPFKWINDIRFGDILLMKSKDNVT